jgi:superfamily II DNA or RNA helicase
MPSSKEDIEKDKQQRIRWAIKRQKQRENYLKANATIKNGKITINNLGKARIQVGQQSRGRSNKAGSGLNSQEGKKKTKEDRKVENRTEQDETNEKASWLVNFQDKTNIELVKKFDESSDEIPVSKNTSKKTVLKTVSKRDQIRFDNNKRILLKKVSEEKSIINKIVNCSTFEEVYYFYRSVKHCQVLYLFTALKWCFDKYTELSLQSKSSKRTTFINEIYLKMKIILLHIDGREQIDIDDEALGIFEKCTVLTDDMNSVELQLKGKILPKPMNDFKDVQLKADFWQSEVIKEINACNNILVCAPTSTGKTIIGTYMASRKGKTLFIVPNESVAIQVTGVIISFANGNYSVQTKNFIIENEDATMIIGTPIEVENYLIKSNKYDFNNIIIDEIHCLNNDTTQEQVEYGNAIKRLMMLLSGQFLLLSATLTDESMDNLKLYIEIIKNKECKVIKHTERFINLQFHIMNNDKDIESVNPFSQIDLTEIAEFKGKNMSITNLDIWNFWKASLDEDEFIPQITKWLGNGLLDINKIQKMSGKIPVFIQNQFEEDPEYIKEVLEEVGSNTDVIEIDMNNKEELNSILLDLVLKLKDKDLLPAIIFQNDIIDCHEIHQQLIDVLEKAQDVKYPTYYEDKKHKAKEFAKLQSKIDKMEDSTSKIKATSKQDRDSAHKAKEQSREAQKEQISTMKESQYDIDLNVHAPHPEYSCGISQISDDSMRQVRWDMKLKTSAYESNFMKGVQRGIGLYTYDMPSINQHVMRRLIMDKNIGLLIADDSLAYGVNLPIRTVIIMYDGTVSSQTILQQIGRAGRRGLDTQGNIIIINVRNNTGNNPIKEILMAKFPTINPYLDKEYFSFTELIKPFCTFETRSKSEKYLELLYTIIAEKPVSLVENSIEEKFISMLNTVFLNDSPEIIEYLKKVMWLIETFKVNSPVNAKLVCYIPYNINKNLSTVMLYLLMPFLNEQLGSLTGISHTDSRYFFRLILWLYDETVVETETTSDIDEELLTVLADTGFIDVFGPVSQFKYSDDIYHHFIHNSVPGDKRTMIKMKFRLTTIHDILKSISKTVIETEFAGLNPLIISVMIKVAKMIQKCQIL